jgi:hypothetical protein
MEGADVPLIIPPEHELLALFEVEPVVLDPDVPWAYNTVTFTTNRGQDEVRCVLVPGYSEIGLTWSRDGRAIVQLALERVKAVHAEMDDAGERLIVAFSEKVSLPDLIVQLKPLVKVQWGAPR